MRTLADPELWKVTHARLGKVYLAWSPVVLATGLLGSRFVVEAIALVGILGGVGVALLSGTI